MTLLVVCASSDLAILHPPIPHDNLTEDTSMVCDARVVMNYKFSLSETFFAERHGDMDG